MLFLKSTESAILRRPEQSEGSFDGLAVEFGEVLDNFFLENITWHFD